MVGHDDDGIVGAKLPDDRPIDGVDQIDVLFAKSATGHREALISFVGGDLLVEPPSPFPKLAGRLGTLFLSINARTA